jgi:hypothetical protein
LRTQLSIRLPWHDRGWDGCVCDSPIANVYSDSIDLTPSNSVGDGFVCQGGYRMQAHQLGSAIEG